MADNGRGGVHHGLQALGVGPNKQKKEGAARLVLAASAYGLGSDPVMLITLIGKKPYWCDTPMEITEMDHLVPMARF